MRVSLPGMACSILQGRSVKKREKAAKQKKEIK